MKRIYQEYINQYFINSVFLISESSLGHNDLDAVLILIILVSLGKRSKKLSEKCPFSLQNNNTSFWSVDDVNSIFENFSQENRFKKFQEKYGESESEF